MELMVALKDITPVAGDVILAGTVIQAADPDRLISSGRARKLNTEETRAVLDLYVEEAKRVFDLPDAVQPLLLESGKITGLKNCHICHESAWWLSKDGAMRCGRCHPPAREATREEVFI